MITLVGGIAIGQILNLAVGSISAVQHRWVNPKNPKDWVEMSFPRFDPQGKRHFEEQDIRYRSQGWRREF